MCGIVGYTGTGEAGSIIIEGLKKLEYRGYDSAGLALQDDGKLVIAKTAGTVATLEKMYGGNCLTAKAGIGHTRWASHGRPTDENAHPHGSCSGDLAIVHNGIIENFKVLRRWLVEEKNHRFRSETDSEVLAHLIEEYYEGDLLAALRRAMGEVKGSYALVAISAREPGRIVCARRDSPLVIGLGEKENLVASDIPALLNHTRRVMVLEDGEFASVTAKKVEIYNDIGKQVQREIMAVNWDLEAAEKDGFAHFMLKEIMEQPAAVRETLRQRIDLTSGKVDLSELAMDAGEISRLKKIHIVACGTAYHAGLLGREIIENIAGIPVDVEVASEFRYRRPLLAEDHLAIVISQSGETADTLAALRLARSQKVKVLAVTNVVGSTVAREADRVLFTWAGPEIAVASTKAYLTQLVALYLLAFYLGQERGCVDPALAYDLVKGLLDLPGQLEKLLVDKKLEKLRAYSDHLARWDNAFFIGRSLDYPVAREGALKLKEISYIHAEAYAAGELKHGPLALIDEGVPVIALVTQEAILDKSLSNIQEVKTRGGSVFIITRGEFNDLIRQEEAVFTIPPVSGLLAPILGAVPTQLMAYYTALARGCSVDKPRNLAKSVTVE
ncbi:MAG TPA: glutamine--fructose-6-phosphate transaminase (isomerizing) [Firmicutes bacterium]|mgnify:CR=1 FL=1|nr:glutamine--fructose-6-phosphate transaminase (isomerizing) [Bacillota bacterium]